MPKRPAATGVATGRETTDAPPGATITTVRTEKPNPYTRRRTRYPGITYRIKADGKRTYSVFAQGKQHRAGHTEAEALALQATLRGKVARGERLTTADAKFATLAEDWYDSKRLLRPWTLKDYRAALDNVLLPRFGNLKLASITPDRIAALICDLQGKGLSGNRIANLLKPLTGTIKLAMRRGLISQNPLDLLTADERPKRLPREHHVWSPEDIHALLSASTALAKRPTAHYHYTPLLRVAIFTGLRIGELLGLCWQDIDLKEAVIHVRLQWTRTGELASPKTPKAIRRVPIAPDLVKQLTEHKLASGYAQEDDFVFPSKKGTPLFARNVVLRGFEPALELAGLNTAKPKITFHDLRHAFASIMIERGINSTVLADVMGHRDSRTTERIYIHLFNRQRTDDSVRAAMQSAMNL